MSRIVEVYVSDELDTSEYDVTEVHVSKGDQVNQGDVLVVVEGDKTSIEIAAEYSGVVQAVNVIVGSVVSSTHNLIELKVTTAEISDVIVNGSAVSVESYEVDVVVIGAGPGGYTAAFRCADLGAKVLLVDKDASLGGTCLNVGCIPSKALLHAANVIQEVEDSVQYGLSFKSFAIDIQKLRNWKNSIVAKLTGGIKHLANKRNITVLTGNAFFKSKNKVKVVYGSQSTEVVFNHAIIATGSYPIQHEFLMPHIIASMSSDNALELEDIPNRLMVIGCGVIGMEMASVYQALGSRVTLVELGSSILFGVDPDLVSAFEKEKLVGYEKLYLQSIVTAAEINKDGITVTISRGNEVNVVEVDKVLVAIGRNPRTTELKLEMVDIICDERGFIDVDENYQTSATGIYAIGDVIGGPMLAHKAVYEGKAVAELIMNHPSNIRSPSIPAVVYTDPEIAWVGITEERAKLDDIQYKIGKINWNINGRLLCHGQNIGVTKILVDPDTDKILGAGIIGPNAGDLITELTLAIDLELTPADLAKVIHPHPTFSETTLMASENYLGIATDSLN